MSFIKRFYDRFVNREKLTESAVLAGHVFEDDEEGISFFDSVLARFENFDQANGAQGNKSFSDDVDFILQCTSTSLSSKESSQKFANRIDSYLYIYRRIEEYLVIIKGMTYWSRTFENNVKQLKDKIVESLIEVFVKNKGLQPNICLKDKDQLKKINIVQHLMSITKVDGQTITTFLVLSKLSLQCSSLTDNDLQWKQIITNIQSFGITMEEFILKYIDYELAFQAFPFDLLGLIELACKNHPPKYAVESPFIVLLRNCKKLNLNAEDFFEQYRPIFESNLKQKSYGFLHMSEFFKLIGRRDRIFDLYFSTYAANVEVTDLWTMFISISINGELNEINQKHLMSKLSDRTMNTSVDNFRRYARLTKESLIKIKEDYSPRFITIFEKVFDSFMNKQMNEERYYHKFTDSDLKEFLNIGLEMSLTHNPQRLSCRLIIQRLLFENDNRPSKIADRIKNLFKKLNDFDQNLCENNDPAFIIEDEWLQNYLLSIPNDFLNYINENAYQYLCDHHGNNRWTIYIWKRLIHLSILKSKTENGTEMLLKMNDWMNKVKHNTYDINDTLTIILVINLFELVIDKYAKSVSSLPNIEAIMNILLHARQEQLHELDAKQVDDFTQNVLKSIEHILFLQGKNKLSQFYIIYSILGTCPQYRELLNPSMLYCFLQLIDIKHKLSSINPQQYKFPVMSPKIESVVPNAPKDINITAMNSKEDYFHQFIEQVNEWLQWFDRFLSIFLYIIEWLKDWKIDGAVQLFNDIHRSRNNPSINVIQMKTIVERTLKLIRPFSDLRRLCHLFNCLTSFQLIDAGGLNNELSSSDYIRELKRVQPTNTFNVDAKCFYQFLLDINDRQHIRWSLACEKLSCNIKITFQPAGSTDQTELLFDKENVSIDKHVLEGEFETQRAGQLMIIINSEQSKAPRVIWYRLKQTPLSTCHLFHGIFNMFYQSYYKQLTETINETEFSKLLDKVFTFIDNLLNGTISLRDMADLKTVFRDKNINIREEVKKLFTNRSSEGGTNNRPRTTMAVAVANIPSNKEIEEVCEWLQIYQYYSHINIIIECIETFNILPADTDDELIAHLKRLRDENCSLKEITQAYRILKQQFEKLTSQHLQLIKTALECSAVIQLMKKSDLYSVQGRRRFQELRDNLTTQFQLQERNNMILNSWIIAYELCEPFVHKVGTFDEFIDRIARLFNFEENSLKHLQSKTVLLHLFYFLSFFIALL